MKTKKQFYAFLKEKGMYKEYKRRTKAHQEGGSVKEFLKTTPPERWVISAFKWSIGDKWAWMHLCVEWLWVCKNSL